MFNLYKFKKKSDQQGIALLTVLLATSLMAILAVSMTFAQHIDIRRTENLLNGDQALLLALGLEEWAVQLLIRDSDNGGNDHLGEDWALGLMPVAAGDGIISGSIVDLQGKINLNNLAGQNQKIVDKTELILVELFDFCEVDDGYELVQALGDWLDEDENIRLYGSEDNDYMLNDPAYLAANQPMVTPTELLLVKGVTPENYACLAPYITVLPPDTKININTAEAGVIAALSSSISIVTAEEMVNGRPEGGYSSVSDFTSDPALAGSGVTDDGLSLESNYFLVQGQADYGEAKIDLNSIYSRSTGLWKLLGRSIGTY